MARPLLAYEAYGTGPHHVLALHGWFGDQTSYRPLYDAISGDEFRWICPSYRGYGGSRDLTGDYSIDEIAGDVVALADSLGVTRFSLVGHSMGGKAVQRILANVPDRVHKVAAVAPVPASGVPLDDATYTLFARAAEDDGAAQAIVDFSVGKRLSRAWVHSIVAHRKQVASNAAFSGYLPSWVRSDFHREIDGLRTPVLVAIGEFDKAINQPLMAATFLKWHPNATLTVIANSGHYPMNETPLLLASLIESFLRD